MSRTITSVAILGSGTMGAGIAALCAKAGVPVLLLDVSREAAAKALERMATGSRPLLETQAQIKLITTGSFDEDLTSLGKYDWICEVIIEDLAAKRALLTRVEEHRARGSIVSTNTSGIPLHAITQAMPAALRRDCAVTHFFNPVAVMRLVEVIPGEETAADVIPALADFIGGRLAKGVVYAKDTVNFIGNRIGCFWILAGLHAAARAPGISVETIDALMSEPIGLPRTGLYGLVDLIGLDVMNLVAANLEANLATGDAGLAFTKFPPAIAQMLERGQLGRKAGAGFYRLDRHDDGSKTTQVFDLSAGTWRPKGEVELDQAHRDFAKLMFDDSPEGRFTWAVMSQTLAYASDLVPEISADIVNIDRAMRWGFAWKRGPFEMLDNLGGAKVCERLTQEGRPVPKMLEVLQTTGSHKFYRDDGTFLSVDGTYAKLV
ncbi:MAG: 3-hydroxyacyl-CoA dehydrogenase NAD-binding domain-containing protein [Alphaproteobacteria bacterium]